MMAPVPTPALPPDGPVDVGSVSLPAGRRVRARTEVQVDDWADVLWMTNAPVEAAGELWWQIRDRGSLVPVLLDGLEPDAPLGERRPWDDELVRWESPVPGPDAVARICERAWRDTGDAELAQRAPFDAFPGTAPPGDEPLLDIELELIAGAQPSASLGMVAADRPADVPLAIGWFACSDAFATRDAPGETTALLRSWEDRYGAEVFRLGYASMHLLVRRPPRTEDHALRVAAELFGVASEVHTAEGASVVSVGDIAAAVRASPWWRFWWD